MFNLKRDEKFAEQLIKDQLNQRCADHGYAWSKGNWWEKNIGWCWKRCNLGLRQVGFTKQPELIGGASIFLPQYYPIYRRDDYDAEGKSASIGGPVHWIDTRLGSNAGKFDDVEQLASIVSRFAISFEECILPALERFAVEEDLLDALLAPDWLTSLKLSATEDRRGALITLMLAKREGAGIALKWGIAELERIRAEKPLVSSTARYQELLRCLEYLESKRRM